MLLESSFMDRQLRQGYTTKYATFANKKLHFASVVKLILILPEKLNSVDLIAPK